MTQKLWGGRFEKPFDSDAQALSYSLHIDCRLAPFDIRTNQAHAKALHEAGYLSAQELSQLSQALSEVGQALESPNHTLFENDEDIHSAIERLVTQKLGDLGKKLHTGKSRNDQVLTDVRQYLKQALDGILESLNSLRYHLWKKAHAHQTVIFPGFTHFQPAQPVVLAHHLLAYFDQFSRDVTRFQEVRVRTDVCPLGSGALAGNNYGLNRQLVAQELGFSAITTNSMDAVSDRDFILEFISAASICMTHLSRFCEELVLWNSPLIKFVDIGDEFTTGSSLMPQKKNPDIAELIRGKSGRVLGHFVALSHIMKAMPLTYNRDFQEDKEPLFDTVDTLSLCLTCFTKMLQSIRFNPDGIDTALKKGYMLATDFADYLVEKGIPFRESHDITGRVVSAAASQNKALEELSLAELQSFSPVIQADVQDVFNYTTAVNRKNIWGGTASNQIQTQLNRIQEENQWQ